MSGLAEDDDLSTLDAAIAFIDSFESTCEAAPIDHDSTPSPDSSTSSSPQPSGTLKHKNRLRGAQASARHYYKKRGELVQLREEVELLEFQLAAIKASTVGSEQLAPLHSTGASLPSPSAGSSTSHCRVRLTPQHALQSRSPAFYQKRVQRKLRQNAEVINCQLREELRHQQRVAAELLRIVKKRLKPKDIASLLEATAPRSSLNRSRRLGWRCDYLTNSSTNSERDDIVGDLRIRLRILSTEIGETLRRINSSSDGMVSSSIEVKQHPQLGALVEVSSSTVLPCTVREAWSMYNNGVSCLNEIPDEASSYKFEVRVIDKCFSEKMFSLSFDDRQLGRIYLDGISLLQKIDRDDYCAYLGTALTIPRKYQIRFRECVSIAISKSVPDPRRRCVFRQRYQLFAEAAEANIECIPQGVEQSDKEIANDEFKRFLLNSLASRMRGMMQALEGALLRSFDGNPQFIPIL